MNSTIGTKTGFQTQDGFIVQGFAPVGDNAKQLTDLVDRANHGYLAHSPCYECGYFTRHKIIEVDNRPYNSAMACTKCGASTLLHISDEAEQSFGDKGLVLIRSVYSGPKFNGLYTTDIIELPGEPPLVGALRFFPNGRAIAILSGTHVQYIYDDLITSKHKTVSWTTNSHSVHFEPGMIFGNASASTGYLGIDTILIDSNVLSDFLPYYFVTEGQIRDAKKNV